MHALKLVAVLSCVCLVGCSTLSNAVSLTAVLSEKPADKYAAQQGVEKHSVVNTDCMSCL